MLTRLLMISMYSFVSLLTLVLCICSKYFLYKCLEALSCYLIQDCWIYYSPLPNLNSGDVVVMSHGN
jgi:hypothetical protein